MMTPVPQISPITPASRYEAVDDLWVVSCYFNSAGFNTKRSNCLAFLKSLDDSGVNFRIIECAFHDQPFTLPESPAIQRIGGQDVMWQKERLLNVAIESLPPSCTKVAWIDCDVLFANPGWASTASAMLDQFPVVQLFEHVIRLPRGQREYRDEGDCWDSFATIYRKHPDLMLAGDFADHGHSGFAWAARREVLAKHGLYDACISGSGDHMMAHAFCGDWNSPCIGRILGANSRHRDHFSEWCGRLYSDVRARVGVVPGTLLHLWHGDMDSRRYVLRNRELAGFDFDPDRDIRIGAGGCWEWASSKPDLHRWAVDYYPSRREDG